MITLENVREFALDVHGDQRYGDEPYEVHLAAVATGLVEYGYTDLWYMGWLHDTMEDSSDPEATYDEIRKRFGQHAADLTRVVSGFGPNRKARVAMILSNIRDHTEGAIVKAVDRLVNMRKAIDSPSHAQMYRREHPDFVEAVRPHISGRLLADLEKLGR